MSTSYFGLYRFVRLWEIADAAALEQQSSIRTAINVHGWSTRIRVIGPDAELNVRFADEVCFELGDPGGLFRFLAFDDEQQMSRITDVLFVIEYRDVDGKPLELAISFSLLLIGRRFRDLPFLPAEDDLTT